MEGNMGEGNSQALTIYRVHVETHKEEWIADMLSRKHCEDVVYNLPALAKTGQWLYAITSKWDGPKG